MRIVLLLLVPSLLFAQIAMFDPPLSDRIIDVRIDCRLDPETKIVSGTEVLEWRNATEDKVEELQFHLYQNAFRDEHSSFLTELPEFPEQLRGDWGHCKISSIKLSDGKDLTPEMRFIQPDDGNPYDKTVCSLALPEPVDPGEVVELTIEFESKLPPVVSRSGYEKEFFAVTQWYPRIGVYEDGRWVCHQYHSHGEFYGDFGVFDVTMTVPENYIVGATGIRIEESFTEDGWKRVRHYCEDVHDFAWCADPDFVEVMDRWGETDIRFLCQPEHAAFADRFIRAVKVTFEYFGSRYGEYPYPIITMVDAKHRDAGEMEYPTLFLTGNHDAYYGIAKYQAEEVPACDRYIEWLTIHEFGHNWWMGMVANDETEHVWVDEGINTYASTKALEYGYDKYLLKDCDGLTETAREHDRLYYLDRAEDATVLQTSWLYRPGLEFFTFTYCKPALMLYTMNNFYGEEVWGEVMKTFFQRWKFRHPKTQDFYDVVHEVTSDNWQRFFDEFMTTTHTLDFKVERVAGDTLVVARVGELRFPVSVLVHFEDGSEEEMIWKNISSSVTYDFTGKPEIEWVRIDPDFIIEFELYRENNIWMNGKD